MTNEFFRPGQKAPKSGQYELVGPKGGSRNREVTTVKNEPLPPTPEPGLKYKLVDETKHKKKK